MEWYKIFSGEAEARERLTEGKPQLLIIDGKRITLVCFKDSFRAVQDACTHNGESLSKGHVNYLGEIICPWHNYCFDMASGREIQGRASDLIIYDIKIDQTGFYIGLP